MSHLATGVDLIEIERVSTVIERFGMRFLARVFTSQELAEVGDNVVSLAARFAAKESVAKALGTGIGTVGWKEIEITRGPAREPTLSLYGTAQRLAKEQHLDTWSISLSHTHTHAIALVVALGDKQENPMD
jgi:holo-[acyl-carrier protein] synthase